MTDYLKNKVRETEKLLSEATRQVDVLRGELRAYKDALTHSRMPPLPVSASSDTVQAGRQVNTAAQKPPTSKRSANSYWKDLIAEIATPPVDTFTIDDVATALRKHGKTMERKSIRAKLVDLVKDGYVIRIQDGLFKAAPRGLSGDELRAAGIIPAHARLIGEDAA